MCKVNNKDTRTTPFASLWCLYCKLCWYFTPCSSVSVVTFEQVNADWELCEYFWNWFFKLNQNTIKYIIFFILFQANVPFYTPWKRQKISGFLTFSGGTEIENWLEMDYNCGFKTSDVTQKELSEVLHKSSYSSKFRNIHRKKLVLKSFF